MLKINRLKDSKFYTEKLNWITTRQGHGAFGESDDEGYWERGVYFNSSNYCNDIFCTIELDGNLIGVINFENLAKELQQAIDLPLYYKLHERELEEYKYFMKLKDKYDNDRFKHLEY